MNNSIFWIALGAYALHILEEYFYDWRNWAQHTLKLPVDWTGFYVSNVAVLFLGLVCASVGWSNPVIALAYPGLMFINAVFMHILPIFLTRRFSPGVITSCLLFLPTCYFAYNQAMDAGVSMGTIGLALVAGGLVLGYPITLLLTKDLKFFDQKS